MNGLDYLINFVGEQDTASRREIITQAIGTLKPAEQEAIILEEMEFIGPDGLARIIEKAKELKADFHMDDHCDDCGYKLEGRCHGDAPCLRLDNRIDQIIGDKLLERLEKELKHDK